MRTANIATYNGRQEFLKKTIESLKNQTVKFHRIRVWYNDYIPEKEDFEQHYNGMDYTDRGKFIWLDNIKLEGKKEVYFSCDDDLIYPPDYVEKTLKAARRYRVPTVLSWHGRRLLGEGRNYYFEHRAFNFMATIPQDEPIHVPGTGVTAFFTTEFMPDIIQYKDNCMADVLMGLEMAKAGVPGVCLAHERGWIKAQKTEDSIYKNHARRCSRQSRYADKIWAYCKNKDK